MNEKLILADRLEQKGHHIVEVHDMVGRVRIYVNGEYMNLFRLRWFINWKGRRK